MVTFLVSFHFIFTMTLASTTLEEPHSSHTSDEWREWAFASAAPAELGAQSTILDASMAVLRNGSSDWSCMPANPRGMANPVLGWADPHEAMPVCFDSVGLEWMGAWMAGETPSLSRSTIVYMLHGDMGEDNTMPGVLYEEDAAPGQWIASGPHVMLMPQVAADLEGFPTDWTQGEPYVMFDGNDYAHLMIPLEDYYRYSPEQAVEVPAEPEGSHTSAEWQVWAFSTAAPAELGSRATVMDHMSQVLRNGTNGWTCMPANPRGMADEAMGWANPHEAMPLCVDEVGMQWIMAYMAGEKPSLPRASISYMLHGDMGEDNTRPGVLFAEDAEPGQWIASGPHIMLIPKDSSDLDQYPSDWRSGQPYSMFAGNDYAHLMIPLNECFRYAEDHTSVEWQVEAFASAAPAELGAQSTILDASMAVLRNGSSDWSCMPANPRGMANPVLGWADPHEAMPVCFDSVGLEWMGAWMAGETPSLSRSTIVYMLHGDMGEDNTMPGVLYEEDAAPGQWIASGPHVMLMPQVAADLEGFPTDWTQGEPYVMFDGNDYAHLMIPLEDYYRYSPEQAVEVPAEPEGSHTSAEWQVWAFSTAAPAELGSRATVMDHMSQVLRNGTNGWTCMPANPRGMADEAMGWANPHEAMPLCVDEVGMQWIMAYMAGEKPSLPRASISYMLHGDMGEDNTRPGVLFAEDAEPGQWIASGPHIMLIPKDSSDLDQYPSDWRSGQPYSMFAGNDYAHLMIPLNEYFRYADDPSFNTTSSPSASDSKGGSPSSLSGGAIFLICLAVAAVLFIVGYLNRDKLCADSHAVYNDPVQSGTELTAEAFTPQKNNAFQKV